MTSRRSSWPSIPALKDYSYAGESYDAVNLIALASEAAKSTKGTDIAKPSSRQSLKAARSAATFPSCVTLLRNGKDIDYDGQSGPVTFSDAGDPTEAYIGIYEYQDDNTYKAGPRKNSASCKPPSLADNKRPPSSPDGGLLRAGERGERQHGGRADADGGTGLCSHPAKRLRRVTPRHPTARSSRLSDCGGRRRPEDCAA